MDGGKVSREGCTGACTKRKEAITLHCSQGDVCALPLRSGLIFHFQFGFSHTVTKTNVFSSIILNFVLLEGLQSVMLLFPSVIVNIINHTWTDSKGSCS